MKSSSFKWLHVPILALAFMLTPSAYAQTDNTAKQAAAERYLRAAPMKKMMEDMYPKLAKMVPAEKQAQFIADMRSALDIGRLEQIAKEGMIKTFTVEELNALADFYSSEHGASAMSKFGTYMGDAMPLIMQEVQRGIQELQARRVK